MSESGGFRSFQDQFGAKKLVKCANNPGGTKLRLFVFLFGKGAFSGKTMHKKVLLRRHPPDRFGRPGLPPQQYFLYPDFLLYFYKRRHGFFQMFLLVCGRQLHADTGLALGHHGVEKTDDVDAFVQEFAGEGLCQRRII